MRFPWLESDAIEAAALGLVSRAGLGARRGILDLDVIIYDFLSERESLSFDDERDLGWEGDSQILGRTLALAGRIEITRTLKSSGQLGRYRFTVAHELGHWVLHRPLIMAERTSLDLFSDSLEPGAMQSISQDVFPQSLQQKIPPEEWQANRFAVGLLVEAELLREAYAQRFGVPPMALNSAIGNRFHSLRALSRSVASGGVGKLSPLRDVFGLSTEAMAIALETRGYVVVTPPMI